MRHPLLGAPEPHRVRIALALAAATTAIMAWLRALDGALKGTGSEGGIVGLELCGAVDACTAQLASIEARGASATLAFSLGLDYLFMPAYSTAIAAALVFLGAKLEGPVARSVAMLAWAQWVAALLDALENFALWQMVQHGAADPWPTISAWCAIVKFAIVLVGLAGVLALAVARAMRRE